MDSSVSLSLRLSVCLSTCRYPVLLLLSSLPLSHPLPLPLLSASFHNQLEAYMGQLGTPHYQQWITDAIEKEKMKKNHLQGVINHLESEVAVLSRETVDQMKENMKEVS